MYKFFLRPLLFLLPAEKAHAFTIKSFELLCKIPLFAPIFKSIFQVNHPQLEREVFGLKFKNPVGLAAGFDKNGAHVQAMSLLGFGFIEVGTVTPKGQIGNPKPRLFRIKEDEALINRMGFNNEGLDALLEQLKNKRPAGLIIGGNIGKNKITPNEEAVKDYQACFQALFPYVDYFVVNVSSPNTPNLRALQDKEPLTKLLDTLQKENIQKSSPKPILLKIAPDLTNEQLDDIVEIVTETNIAGLIATNTTISREGLKTAREKIADIGAGGLSGRPLRQRSTEVIRYISNKTNGRIPIIGVGGIATPEDALEKIKAGATLVQLYSGFIYEGPALVKKINKAFLADNA